MIDSLLESPQYINNFSNFWTRVMMPESANDFEARNQRPGFQAWLRQHLQDDPVVQPKDVEGWIADLNSSQFNVRNQAVRSLTEHLELAQDALHQARQKSASLETKRRIDQLLKMSPLADPSSKRLRIARTVELLELIGDDLRKRGLVALTVAVRAGHQGDAAVPLEAYPARFAAGTAAGFDKRRNPRAKSWAAWPYRLRGPADFITTTSSAPGQPPVRRRRRLGGHDPESPFSSSPRPPMHPRYIPTVDQFHPPGAYDGFLLEHREPSRVGEFLSRALRSDRPARGRVRPPARWR